MRNLFKKAAFIAFAVVLVFLFSFCVFSAKVTVGEDFFAYGEQTDKVCEILGIEENGLQSYCEQNNIAYLAVDKDNKRQIKLLCYETDFSNSIINITSMNDDNISVLIPQIVGIENAKGDVITQGEQKFVKTAVKTSDSGGEYILTSYYTVADKKNYVLNFYTLKGEDTGYINEIFEDYAKSKVFGNQKEMNFNLWKVLIFIGVAVFTSVFILVGVTVIKDLKKQNSEENKETE